MRLTPTFNEPETGAPFLKIALLPSAAVRVKSLKVVSRVYMPLLAFPDVLPERYFWMFTLSKVLAQLLTGCMAHTRAYVYPPASKLSVLLSLLTVNLSTVCRLGSQTRISWEPLLFVLQLRPTMACPFMSAS